MLGWPKMLDEQGNKANEVENGSNIGKPLFISLLIRPSWLQFFKDYVFFYLVMWCHFVVENLIFYHKPYWNDPENPPFLFMLFIPQLLAIAFFVYYLPFYFFIRVKKSPEKYSVVTCSFAALFWLWVYGGSRSLDYNRSNFYGPTYLDGIMTANGLAYSLFSVPVFIAIFSLILLARKHKI